MPSGKIHDKITLATCLPIGIMAWYFYDLEISLVVFNSYLFSGLMFNGDLDLDSDVYKRWGPLRILWWPYKKTVPHRSVISHGPVVGTAMRLIWLALLFSPLIYYIDIKTMNIEYIIACVIGLEMGAMSHTVADYFF